MLLKRLLNVLLITIPLVMISISAKAAKRTFNAPHNVAITIKNFYPLNQETDLHIITLLKHNPDSDKYIDGLNDLNDELGGLISNLRQSGEFIGELGETILFTPPFKSIKPKKILLIGMGDESELTVDKFKIAGRIAAHQAVRLQAKNISLAPTLQHQGVVPTAIDLGDVDAALAEEIVLTYDIEKRLQNQQFTPEFDIKEWIIEAGAGNFDNATTKVEKALKDTVARINERKNNPTIVENIVTSP